MLALEVVAAIVLLALVALVTWMAVVGLIGSVGGVSMTRCRQCAHLHPTWPGLRRAHCPYCSHPWLVRHVLPTRLRHRFPGEMDPLGP